MKPSEILLVIFFLLVVWQPNETASDGFFISWAITMVGLGAWALYMRHLEDKDEKSN